MATRMNPGHARRRDGNHWRDEIVGARTAGEAVFVEHRTIDTTTFAIFRGENDVEWAQATKKNPSASSLPPSARKSPPKKYADLGFLRPDDYAMPEAWEYPVGGPQFAGKPEVARAHAIAAKARFAANKMHISAHMRATVAKNIDMANRRWSVGEVKRANPARKASPATATVIVPLGHANPARAQGTTAMAQNKGQKLGLLKGQLTLARKRGDKAKVTELEKKIAAMGGTTTAKKAPKKGKTAKKKAAAKKRAKKTAAAKPRKARKAAKKSPAARKPRKSGKRRAPAKGKRRASKRAGKSGTRRTRTSARVPGGRASVNLTVNAKSGGASNPAKRRRTTRKGSKRKGASKRRKTSHRRKGASRRNPAMARRSRMSLHNPVGSGWMNVALLGGGIFLGYIVGSFVDRLVATRTPTNGAHAWYGPDAAQMIGARRDAVRHVVAIGGGLAALGASYWTGKKGWEKTSFTLAGVGMGWLLDEALNVFYTQIVPAAMKVEKGDEMTLWNRVYPDTQSYVYDFSDNYSAALNKAAEAGKDKNEMGLFTTGGQAEKLPASWDTQLQATILALKDGAALPGAGGSLGSPPPAQPQRQGFPQMRAATRAPTGLGTPPPAQPVAAARPAPAPAAAAPAPAPVMAAAVPATPPGVAAPPGAVEGCASCEEEAARNVQQNAAAQGTTGTVFSIIPRSNNQGARNMRRMG